jgi:hypothetical protein
MEERLLQVGDMIYAEQFGNYISRFRIVLVTDKYAFGSQHQKLNRKIGETGWIDSPSSEKWRTISYWIETPERKTEFDDMVTLHFLSNYDWNKLTPEIRLQIKDILKRFEAKSVAEKLIESAKE